MSRAKRPTRTGGLAKQPKADTPKRRPFETRGEAVKGLALAAIYVDDGAYATGLELAELAVEFLKRAVVIRQNIIREAQS